MDIKIFTESLTDAKPLDQVASNVYLHSLWYVGKDNWEQAHTLIQDIEGTSAAAIHAYLHRQEGDNWNADYWYRRAGTSRPSCTLQEEWILLVKQHLKK